jgi:hypothetical protein
MWKLLIIESFSQWKLYEIENKQCIEIWGCSWNALGKSDLIDFYFTIFRAKVWRYWFLSGFCCWKFKQFAKTGFGRKSQLSPQCVHICKFFIGNVFALGPMASATLVYTLNGGWCTVHIIFWESILWCIQSCNQGLFIFNFVI